MAFWLAMPMLLVLLLNTVLSAPDRGLEDVFNVLMLVGFVVALGWAAVGWLRFVLLEEPTSTAGIAVRLVSVWRFLLRLAVVGFALSVLATFLGFILLVSMMVPEADTVVTVLVNIGFTVLTWLFLRISPFLTAAGLGQRMGVTQAWEVTKPYAKTLSIVAVMYFGLLWLLPKLTEAIFGGLPFLWEPVEIAMTCFNALLGISLLTVIHGVCVDGREID